MIAKVFRSFLLVALIAGLLAHDSHATPNRTPAPAVVDAATLEKQEQQLVEEIDRQADAIFEKLKREQPQLPSNLFQRTQREAVYRLKQMHVLTDVLKSAGPSPAIALVASEVLTTFVLAPMFVAKGNVVMATAMTVIPWGVIAGGAAASFDMMKHRLILARELNSGLGAMREADKIRDIVLGYDVKHRISSLMLEAMDQSLDKEIEFEVVKRMRNPDLAKTPFVTMNEVEALVKSVPEGRLFIQQIYFERLDRELFTALLLRFLNEHDELSERLLDVLRARSPIVTIQTPEFRKHLIAIDDMKKLIARDLRTIQLELKETNRKRKSGELEYYQAEWEKKHLDEESKRLQRARGDVVRHEYTVLLGVKEAYEAKDYAAVETITSTYSKELYDLREGARHVPPTVAAARQRVVRETSPTPRIINRAMLCSQIFGARSY